MDKQKILVLVFGILLLLGLFSNVVSAHRSGCHAWHSCSSDRGTYICGDTGHCSQCPDNAYCLNGQPRSDSQTTESTNSITTAQSQPALELNVSVVTENISLVQTSNSTLLNETASITINSTSVTNTAVPPNLQNTQNSSVIIAPSSRVFPVEDSNYPIADSYAEPEMTEEIYKITDDVLVNDEIAVESSQNTVNPPSNEQETENLRKEVEKLREEQQKQGNLIQQIVNFLKNIFPFWR